METESPTLPPDLEDLIQGFNIFSQTSINEARGSQISEPGHQEYSNNKIIFSGLEMDMEHYHTEIFVQNHCLLHLWKLELSKFAMFLDRECIYVPLMFILLLSTFSIFFTEFVSLILSFSFCLIIIWYHYYLKYVKKYTYE